MPSHYLAFSEKCASRLFLIIPILYLYFREKENTTYSLADVYDYDIYNFYSYLSEVNADSTAWTAIRVSLERVESLFEGETATDAMKLIKTIGMFNLFGKAGVQFNKEKLSEYAKFALGIDDPVSVIELLTQHKIIMNGMLCSW